MEISPRRVAYYYDREFCIPGRPLVHWTPELTQIRTHPLADVGSYSYGSHHPMKPLRMRITHELLTAYDLLPKMEVLVRSSLHQDQALC